MKRRKKQDRIPPMPPMRCDKDCDQCCGMAPASPDERAEIEEYIRRHDIKALRQGTPCPFFQQGRCAVYPVRPAICRLFGHVREMACPRGHSTFIPREQHMQIQRWLVDRADPEKYTLLHEMAGYSQIEILEMFLSESEQPCITTQHSLTN